MLITRLSLRSGENFTTRAKNKQYALQKSCYSLIKDLPNCLNPGSPSMYVDDTNITFTASNMIDLETQINTELKSTNLWFKANKLRLNVPKLSL